MFLLLLSYGFEGMLDLPLASFCCLFGVRSLIGVTVMFFSFVGRRVRGDVFYTIFICPGVKFRQCVISEKYQG